MADGHRIRRQRLVAQLERQGIRSAAVLRAIGKVPRERFVDEALQAKAYSDAPLPIGEKQTISQPWIVAKMSELLEPGHGSKVLEIGTGSGYQAAVLSYLFERVYSVERLPDLSRRARETLRALDIPNVHLKIFDGSYGWGEFAPYPAILVTASVPEIPQPLLAQLEDGGRMVLPVSRTGTQDEQVLVRVLKQGDRIVEEEHGLCRFVPLLGKFGWEART